MVCGLSRSSSGDSSRLDVLAGGVTRYGRLGPGCSWARCTRAAWTQLASPRHASSQNNQPGGVSRGRTAKAADQGSSLPRTAVSEEANGSDSCQRIGSPVSSLPDQVGLRCTGLLSGGGLFPAAGPLAEGCPTRFSGYFRRALSQGPSWVQRVRSLPGLTPVPARHGEALLFGLPVPDSWLGLRRSSGRTGIEKYP